MVNVKWEGRQGLLPVANGEGKAGRAAGALAGIPVADRRGVERGGGVGAGERVDAEREEQ